MGLGVKPSRREKIFALTNGRCWYCGRPAAQIDHINPAFLGGTSDDSNLVPVCKWCNKSKRHYPLEVWRGKLALKAGIAFTPEQRAFWGSRLPEDQRYTFWFETRECSHECNNHR